MVKRRQETISRFCEIIPNFCEIVSAMQDIILQKVSHVSFPFHGGVTEVPKVVVFYSFLQIVLFHHCISNLMDTLFCSTG